MSHCKLVLCFSLAMLLNASGQVSLTPQVEACVRSGTSFYADYNEQTSGYCMVKYDVTTGGAIGTGIGKAYYLFDFSGQNPNTNDVLTFECTTYNSSARQHLNVWALNQPYPGISANIIFSTAQANDTNSNQMLTNPTNAFTATLLMDQLSVNGAGAVQRLSIPAPWGQYLFGGKLVLAFTGTNDPAVTSGNGFRMRTNTVSVSFKPLVGNPPSLGVITNLAIPANTTSTPQSFTISDAEDAADSLFPIATSSNEAVVPSGLVAFGGTGGTRTITVTAGATAGTARIDVSVTDSSGNNAVRSFNVTVLPANFPPVIANLGGTNTMLNTAVTIPFLVGDAESHASTLTASAEIKTYSAGILQSATVSSDASGTNRTLLVTPVSGADGVGVVTVNVSDAEGNTSSSSVYVMVLPSTEVAFNEHFDYSPDNSKLFDLAGGLWVRRSATAGSVNLFVGGGQQAYLRPKTSADDGAARLAGAPYVPGSGVVLYTRFKATWLDVLNATDGVITNSVGSLVQLLNTSNATSAATSEIATTTNGVPEAQFRLALIDQTGTLQPYTALNLAVPPVQAQSGPHNVVTRYDVDTGVSTLWVNATSESMPGATSSDIAVPQSVSYVGLRQDSGMGYIYVDDLKVSVAWKPKITRITQPVGGTLELYFTAGPNDTPATFSVQSAADVTGSFTTASGASVTGLGAGQFKATVPATGARGLYKVQRAPMTF